MSDWMFYCLGVLVGWLVTYGDVRALQKKLDWEREFTQNLFKYLEEKESKKN